MSLPDLVLQTAYGRLAWALVVAAIMLALLPNVRQQSKLLIVGVTAALMALPGAASPAYWLTLAFQYPSGLMTGFSVLALRARWQGRRARYTMPGRLAVGVAVVGLVLYLDTFGVLALGLYYGGFNPVAAPLLACAAAIGFALKAWRGQAAGPSAAMLVAVLLFSLLRLPTGNLWDAMLDPVLWAWALGSVLIAVRHRLAAHRPRRAHRQHRPEPAQEPAPARTVAAE
ncbi:hypothetical protein ASF61_09580 [Duganella sp. Leaf126]|uniref:hypothetical protein n=1 Tax=Duganella sp. Leaf126 TaxID=1736266 RepID=UPI0006F9F3AD|nr:hypothetical protein [Duganella sp. Leaf126]KQQ33332.1 hypothetical protein ASF61_09580 [Duganella sp. Leaf126]